MPEVPVSLSPIVSCADYLALPRAPETWLIAPLLPVGGSLLLFGEAKIGKSYAALQLACALATGTPWFGFAVPTKCKVVYIQLDTPRSLWAARVSEFRAEGFPTDALLMADRETLNTYPFNLMDDGHCQLLRSALMPLAPDVVILDTIKEAHNADENDATAMQQVVARLDAVIRPAAMVLVHHARKGNPEQYPSLMNDTRGSNYLVGKMDAIVRFSHKSMRYVGRSVEEDTIKLERLSNGAWKVLPKDDAYWAAAEAILLETPEAPMKDLIGALRETYPDKEDAALRKHLQRVRADLKRQGKLTQKG